MTMYPPLPESTILLGQQLTIYVGVHKIRKQTWINALETFQEWYPQTKDAPIDTALQQRLATDRRGALVPAFERLIGAIQQQQHQLDEKQDEERERRERGESREEQHEHGVGKDQEQEVGQQREQDQGQQQEQLGDRTNNLQRENPLYPELPYMSPLAYIWHKNPVYASIRALRRYTLSSL